MQEMGSSPEIDLIARAIDDEVRLGAIEIKGAWSKGEASTGHRLIETISRSVTHAMNWLGVGVRHRRRLRHPPARSASATGPDRSARPRCRSPTSATGPSPWSGAAPAARSCAHRTRWRPCDRRRSSSPAVPSAAHGPGGARGHPDEGVAPVGARRESPGRARGAPGPAGGLLAPGHRPSGRAASTAVRPRSAACAVPRGGGPALGLLPVAPRRGAAAGAAGVRDAAARPQPQQDHPGRAGAPADLAHRRGRPERRPLDRPCPGHGGPGGRASAGRLRHRRAVQPQPHPRQRPRPGREQGGGGARAGSARSTRTCGW